MKYDFDLEDRSKKYKQIVIKILIFCIELAVVIFSAYLIIHFGLNKLSVTNSYMAPNLKNGDEILINKMSYMIHKVGRNDVVVVKHSSSEHSYYAVERIIGMPGEKIIIKDGIVYVNGKKLKEKVKADKIINAGLANEEIIVDRGEYFTLCDNRNECEDSRNASIGNVKKKDIVGKAWIRLNKFKFIGA